MKSGMTEQHTDFEVRIAISSQDVQAAQNLRYRVFVQELGANGPLVDHDAQLEIDAFDAHAQQLILLDHARDHDDQVVGVYRLMDNAAAVRAGQFYTENEYDLSPLKATGRPLLELGRSCVHPDYRGGVGLLLLWKALAHEVEKRGVEILFGTASFYGTDLDALSLPLSLLARDHMAPDHLRVHAKTYQRMDLTDQIDRVVAMKNIPSLIKAYLRLGGVVGDGAFVDHQFNTTDVCLILDTATMNERQRAVYGGRK